MIFIQRATAAAALFAAVILHGLIVPRVAVAGAEMSPYWIAIGGGLAWLPNEFQVKTTRPQLGAILGARISPQFAAETHVTYLKSDATQAGVAALGIVHFEGNVTWFTAGDRPLSPYLTAGAGLAYLHRESQATSVHRFAMGGGLGVRLAIGDKVSLRLEGRDLRYNVVIPSSGLEETRNHTEAFAGVSFGIGGPARDRDHDGVPDDDDRCLGTPAGARVDAVGCAIDSDDDGVFDGIDKCNNTPPGATVDETGCEHDSDGDKIMDGIDRCPDTPKGALVDAFGCPLDADQDSIYDGIDQCPATPKGCFVNTNGCPTDADQDGVCDGIDECPDSPPNVKVDRIGCPIVVSDKETQLLETGMIRLQNINFDTGRATITPESEPVLDEVGNILARWPELKIEIGGHTDSRGSPTKNAQLSKERAKAVLDYILSKFPELDPVQFTAVGYGAKRPIASNTSELGRSKNRRVEFKVLNTAALKREKTEQRLLPREQGPGDK
jgi:OOP family OmpA-OmpF porin